MTATDRRVIFLAGAPSASSLSWDETSLTASLGSPFRSDQHDHRHRASSVVSPRPSWRSVETAPAETARRRTTASRIRDDLDWDESAESLGFSDNGLPPSPTTGFRPNMVNVASTAELLGEEDATELFQHSFAAHDEASTFLTASSQDTGDSWSSAGVEDSFISTQDMRTPPRAFHLTQLQAVPDAVYIHSIAPQTMTVDLVVGVVSITTPKSITVRKASRQIEMIEMVVGDETQPAFRISVWLPYGIKAGTEAASLNSTVRRLRPHDIILANNIGLCAFRDIVHGQSLRRDLTSLQILHRPGTHGANCQGYYSAAEFQSGNSSDPCLQRARAVKDWLIGYVAPHGATSAAGPRRTRRNSTDHYETLPLDTQ